MGAKFWSLGWRIGSALFTLALVWLAWLHLRPSDLVSLPCTQSETLRPATPLTCVLARQYVTPTARDVALDAAGALAQAYPQSVVHFMDASSRSGAVPLWPHRSHGDGRQLDFALFYEDAATGADRARPPSWMGYGAYAARRAGETDPCPGQTRPVDFGDPKNPGWRLDEARTRALVRGLIADPRVQRVFLAPHLTNRLGLAGEPKVRFAGCQAARHDDHIHVDVVR